MATFDRKFKLWLLQQMGLPKPTITLKPDPQELSIPYNYILYMIDSPSSPEGLAKLYLTCKFFFSRTQILFPPYLCCYNGNDFLDEEREEQIETTAKFWPTSVLELYYAFVPSKFYRFSPTALSIVRITLTLKEFEMLVSENTVVQFRTGCGEILNATVDVVLSKLPNATYFGYISEKEIFTLETFQKLNSLQRNPKLEHLELMIYKVSEKYSPLHYPEFIQQNGKSGSEFGIRFEEDAAPFNAIFLEALKKWETSKPNIVKVEEKNDGIFATLL